MLLVVFLFFIPLDGFHLSRVLNITERKTNAHKPEQHDVLLTTVCSTLLLVTVFRILSYFGALFCSQYNSPDSEYDDPDISVDTRPNTGLVSTPMIFSPLPYW